MDKIRKDGTGYGYLIDWIIRLGDLFFINVFFILVYLFFREQVISGSYLPYDKKIEALFLINLSYFIAASFVRINLSSNIIFFEKIVQNSIYLIALYLIILTGAFSLFGILEIAVITWVIYFFILGAILSLWHIGFRLLLKAHRRRGYNYRTVVIVGGGVSGVDTYNQLVSSEYGYKVLGFFEDSEDRRNAMPDYLGGFSEIKDYIKDTPVDEIYYTLSGDDQEKIVQMIALSEKNMIRLYIVPEFHKYVRRSFSFSLLNTIPILTLRREPLQQTSNRFIKRAFDIIFSALFLVFIFPFVYLIFGVMIKLSSPGPVFFKQKRTGFKGEVFDCYKFRSMKINDLAHIKSATEKDPRITKIGAFMRKTSIDEFPQFINVLKGEMSIIGPRPHMLQHTELYSMLIDKFMVRHLVKPGITGWAQVNGFRGETKILDDMENRVKKDVWYLENWSFLLDLKILLRTIVNLVKGEENAY